MNNAELLGNLIVALTPGGIEQQEAQGQRKLNKMDMLPLKIEGVAKEDLEKIGFVFGAKIDDLFQQCTLPPGWTKHATDHSMWSELRDEQGRKRASIFYKAAFYDRDAFMRFESRFSYRSINTDAGREAPYRVFITDGGVEIHTIGEHGYRDWDAEDKMMAEAKQWLDTNWPQWRNPLAYWE